VVYQAKKVRGAMRQCGLRLKTGKRVAKNSHEDWIDEKGRTAELAVQKDGVPAGFLTITMNQMESKGMCSKREFKRLLRSA
jgi:hypothetical protein